MKSATARSMFKSHTVLRRILPTAMLGIIMISPTGCVTASLATLGTVVGFLGSAASTGADVYKLGKLDSALMATLPQIQSATRHAACNLGLVLIAESSFDGPDVWQVKLLDDQRHDITVRVERRASQLCLCRVDVGLFGAEPIARLVMERIRHDLPAPTNSRAVEHY